MAQGSFSTEASVEPFSVPAETYIKRNHTVTEDGRAVQFVAVSAYVIDAGTVARQSLQGQMTTTTTTTTPRMLLIQRAASDSAPNLWEVPGGACDADDPSILYSCARELWEEAGLIATEIGPRVGEPRIFRTSRGKLVCKLGFLVKTAGATRIENKGEGGQEGQLRVKLDPREHQNHLWASEVEVNGERVGDLQITFTSQYQKQLIIQAFEIWKQSNGNSR